MSSTEQPLPSRCAAMPSSAPMVTTPVPPMPVTTIPYGFGVVGTTGSGSAREIDRPSAFFGLRRPPPSTVTKLGQKPLTQE